MRDRRSRWPLPGAAAAVIALLLLPTTATASNLGSWIPSPFAPAFHGGNAMAVADDGTGSRLFVGGRSVERWDGLTFIQGPRIPNSTALYAFSTFDSGRGPEVIIAGSFFDSYYKNIARWDGFRLDRLEGGLGTSTSAVRALAVYDDGTGPALYAGGSFVTAGGVAASHLARWDGTGWSAVGEGITGGGFAPVRALTTFDDGTGPKLVIAGEFTAAGGLPASNIATWDGLEFAPLGAGTDREVWALAVLEGDDGPALFAGGEFSMAGGLPAAHVARWKDGVWTPLAEGTDRDVECLQIFDDGSGAALFAGGEFSRAGSSPAPGLARWDGTAWSGLGSLPDGVTSMRVSHLAAYDAGRGLELVVMGSLRRVDGSLTGGIRRWNGAAWQQAGQGIDSNVNDLVRGEDSFLYACGEFTWAGETFSPNVARWDGVRWSSLGTGIEGTFGGYANALLSVAEGTRTVLYLGGFFSSIDGVPARSIAKWDGTSWSTLGSGLSNSVRDLVEYDDGTGPSLFAGGAFTQAGEVTANRIAKWDGASWSGVGGGMDGSVSALAAVERDGRSLLYAGGGFTHAGGVPASRVACWDGVSWTPLGSGLDGDVTGLFAADDGTGEALYAGGYFTRAGGVAASGIARWNGSTWEALGTGVECRQCQPYAPAVSALVEHREGDRTYLYMGGRFDTAGGIPASNVARWDGSVWSALDEGISGLVRSVETYTDGAGPAVYFGGNFLMAGGVPSDLIARWSVSNLSLRRGEVNSGSNGVRADVLTVNGTAGDPLTRRVFVEAGAPVSLGIRRAPAAGSSGDYAVWVLDGEPDVGDGFAIQHRLRTGRIVELGFGPRCLPTDNGILSGSCACSTSFPLGGTSRWLDPATAAVLCLNPQPGLPLAPTVFTRTFPAGVFTLCGVVLDANSPNLPMDAMSIANWVIVESR